MTAPLRVWLSRCRAYEGPRQLTPVSRVGLRHRARAATVDLRTIPSGVGLAAPVPVST